MLLRSIRPALSRAFGTSSGSNVPPGASNRHASRFFVWHQVVQACSQDPQKCKEIVAALHKHCVQFRVAPPLKHFNELLRICGEHGEMTSAGLLNDLAQQTNMHLNGETLQRLSNVYTYFPKPGSGAAG